MFCWQLAVPGCRERGLVPRSRLPGSRHWGSSPVTGTGYTTKMVCYIFLHFIAYRIEASPVEDNLWSQSDLQKNAKVIIWTALSIQYSPGCCLKQFSEIAQTVYLFNLFHILISLSLKNIVFVQFKICIFTSVNVLSSDHLVRLYTGLTDRTAPHHLRH